MSEHQSLLLELISTSNVAALADYIIQYPISFTELEEIANQNLPINSRELTQFLMEVADTILGDYYDHLNR